MYDFIIIGAGYGGLASAALLSEQGYKVLVLEAHGELGGCASYYRRGDFSFEVGATTISGFGDGKPINLLAKKLKLIQEFDQILIREQTGMVIDLEDNRINRYSDNLAWLEESSKIFSSNYQETNQQKQFWQNIEAIDKLSWQLLAQNQKLLPNKAHEFLELCQPSKIYLNSQALKLVPGLFLSSEQFLKRFNLHSNQKFKRFLEEQLLITTQNTLSDTPYLMAALGLAYPSEVFYPRGSIAKLGKILEQKITQNQSEILYKQKITSINKTNNGYILTTKSQASFEAKSVIANIPLWDLAKITDNNLQEYFQKYSRRFAKASGAFTINFAVKLENNYPSPYFQIHCSKVIPYSQSRSFFMTMSRKDDRERAPEGWSSITISIHTDSDYWLNIPEDLYQERKNELESFLLEELYSKYPEFRYTEKQFLLSGTPKTFEFYTRRHQGFVGGIAHSIRKPIYNLIPNQIPFDNFYLVGDTTFPGQGIAAVIYSAISTVNKITRDYV